MPAQRKTVVKKIDTAKGGRKDLDFYALVSAIREVHERCVAQAGRAVNARLTLRNWLIGVWPRVSLSLSPDSFACAGISPRSIPASGGR